MNQKRSAFIMRKQTKLVAALSATALLALGASAVVFAAGWDNSTGAWQYLDNEGNAISDAWRKSGDYWFYLGEDGNMATDQLIEDDDDYYYVNADGAMVTNQWVALDTDDNDDNEAEYRWFYFGADGKAYRDKGDEAKLTTSDIKTINGKKYAFDADGKMLYGFVDADGLSIKNPSDDDWATTENQYYFGGWNDGSAQTGWVQLTVNTDNVETKDNDNDTYWFYVDGNGKVQKNKKKTINGATYYFDEYGRMVEDWSSATKTFTRDLTDVASNNIIYVNGDGSARKNQWIWAVPDENYIKKDYDDDEYSWWWAQSSGKLFTNGVKKVKGKNYVFDENGRMLYGIVAETGDSNAKYTRKNANDDDFTDMNGDDFAKFSFGTNKFYYYSNDEEHDGSRKTGYVNVEFDDDTYQMYFKSNGLAENGYVSKIKKYCANGVVLKADNDTSNYGVIDDENHPTTVQYYDDGADVKGKVLVNTSGTRQTNVKNKKDNNDVYYWTDKNGHVTYAGDKLYTGKKGNDDYKEVGAVVEGSDTVYYVEK
jgi:glucan-binding YG repeat protein